MCIFPSRILAELNATFVFRTQRTKLSSCMSPAEILSALIFFCVCEIPSVFYAKITAVLVENRLRGVRYLHRPYTSTTVKACNIFILTPYSHLINSYPKASISRFSLKFELILYFSLCDYLLTYSDFFNIYSRIHLQ